MLHPGDVHGGVAPPRRSFGEGPELRWAFVAGVGLGDEVGHPAVGSLLGTEVAKPLPVEAGDVVEEGSGLDEDLPVACPPRPLPGGAVGGQIAGVAPKAPVADAVEPVDPFV